LGLAAKVAPAKAAKAIESYCVFMVIIASQ